MDRMIGILGGMGPEATLDLYRHIIRLTPAAKDQDHIRVLIYSNPKIPDRTKAISGIGENPLPHLIESAKLLERGGSGIIAIPCNATHHYLPDIQREVSIPILNMIAETCMRIARQLPNTKTIGLLAATGTVLSGVYHKTLSAAGIKVLIPSDAVQNEIQTAINQVKAGTHNLSTQELFQSAGMQLTQAGAQAVILGCTEIPLSFDPTTVGYPTLNPTQILAESAIRWALKNSSRRFSISCI
jgi:aspartate racemase